MKRRICVFTGTRADYGLLRPLLRRLRDDGRFELAIVASGSHFSPEFGFTHREIGQDGFRIDEQVEMDLSSDTPVAITSSMGLCIAGCGAAFSRLRPDFVVLLGDRYECLCAAAAAAVSSIPVAHIHGGESTEGALDEYFRHAITKLSYLHFASIEAYRRRIIQLGEQPERVFTTGALGLDNIRSLSLKTRSEIIGELGLPPGRLLLATFHPATAEPGLAEEHFRQLLAALDSLDETVVVFTRANADEGGRVVNGLIDHEVSRSPRRRFVFPSLGSLNYLSLLSASEAVIGNSSSGIIEAPSLGVPTVDIGERQKGRIRSPSVVHAEPESAAIRKAILYALTPGHRRIAAARNNPYGDGQAADRIAAVLAAWPLRKNAAKPFFDLNVPESRC